MSLRALFLALIILATPALPAGVLETDAPAKEPDAPDDRAWSTEDWYDAFRSRIDGFDAPLFPAPPPDELPRAECGPANTPETHALLVGAGRSTEFAPLPGPANDVDLFAYALGLRGVPAAHIRTLTGRDATHAKLQQVARGFLDRLGCNDSMIVHFSGFAFNAASVGLPKGPGGPFGMVGKDKYLNELGGQSMSRSIADGAIESAPFLLLNLAREDSGAVLSAAALSEFVTQLRNRGAHVNVILDTPSATDFDLEARQARIDRSLYPRLSLTAGDRCGADCPGRWSPSVLAPNAGQLSIFYGTGRGSPGVERRLPPGAEDAQVYGMLSYQLATAITLSERTTIGALARHIRGQVSEDVRDQDYTFVATEPDLDLIAEDRPEDLLRSPQILIDSPQITRAAMKLKKPVIEIRGRIDARGKPIQVKINDSVAQLEGEAGFLTRYKLSTGVNRIAVHAITDENESLRYDFELFYEGDIRQVIGQGKRYALIIASQDYDDGSGIPDLKTPIGDARAVRDLLVGKYGFTTEAELTPGRKIDLFLRDATQRDIALSLGALARLAGSRDSVLIFYAGHGEYDTATNAAYWLPTDAVLDYPATFFDAKTLNDTLQTMQAGNVLVISDSCYSGMLLRSVDEGTPDSIPAQERLQHLQRMSESRSRVVMSSGGNAPVLDGGGQGHSVFARALLTALENPEDNAFSARELYSRVNQSVSVGGFQEPDFRRIYGAGHDGGDFVFLVQD